MNNPVISRRGMMSMQVCVSKDWTDEQALVFAEQENPCGTENGWVMRHDGHKLLAGAPERVACDEREGCVHIMFDA